ncbi:MAG TPA: amidohydrolase family protein [Acidimicrobiales bacterium]
MDKVTFVSADGHAIMRPELWTTYMDKQYHDRLPVLRDESEVFTGTMTMLNDMSLPPELFDVFDKEQLYQSGKWSGLWDADVRLEQLDNEGVAAEFVFHGDFHASELGFSPMNGKHPYDFVDAGVRAYDRWMAETFADMKDRFLLVAPTGTNVDMDATLKELTWVADQGFTGAFVPGFTHFEGLPPLYDPYWEPLWALHADRGLALVVHGGFGFDQGLAFSAIQKANEEVSAAGGGQMDLIVALTQGLFNDDFFRDISCRRAMWQMFLGGVFDRHPTLRLFMTEVRADWIPATLRHLDALFATHRADIPAQRKPSEYWAENCMAGLSFMHTSEVEMRDEIGVETILFGRDYPHTEGTWPNTGDYLRHLFAGVPERDVRLILGENAINFLDLDRATLEATAARLGPSLEDIVGGPEIEPALLDHLATRTGVLKPAEGPDRVHEYETMLKEDMAGASAAAS